MEGGEVWKVEEGVIKSAANGVKNVLYSLGMLEGTATEPAFQMTIGVSKWIRAERGGFMKFHINPGDLLKKGQPLITNTTLLGAEQNTQKAPFDCIVIGMTTLPATGPGEAICNLGKLPAGLKPETLTRLRLKKDGLGQQVSDELSSHIMVHDRT